MTISSAEGIIATPSQMDVETPRVISSELQGVELRNPVTGLSPIDAASDARADVPAAAADGGDDDEMIEVAYHEIRRSVSPEIANYIFQFRGNGSSATKNNLAEVEWTFDRILSIPVTGSELRQISEESADILYELGTNLWEFGKKHACELLYAHHRGSSC